MLMLYLYAIIDSDEPFWFTEQICGRKIFNLTAGDLGLAVSRADGRESELRPENILAHNAVMEQLMERFSVLPVRYGTLLNQESAGQELIQQHGDQFRWQLHRLRGKVEMGVKVLWNISKVQSELLDSEISRDLILQQLGSSSPGHRYLRRKYLEQAPEMQSLQLAKQVATGLHKPLALKSVAAVQELLRTPNLMLSGAYLLTRESVGAFREELERLRKCYSDYRFLLSGPWPPYHFVKITCLVGSE
jgi:hypothetical protein